MNNLANNLHFLYSFMVAIFLSGAALLTGVNTKNPVIPLLFLPLIIYFIGSFYKRLYHWSYQANHESNSTSFHFLLFITQDNPLFLITLGLLILAFTLSIVKSLLLP